MSPPWEHTVLRPELCLAAARLPLALDYCEYVGAISFISDLPAARAHTTSSTNCVAGSTIAAKASVWSMQQSAPPMSVHCVPQLASHLEE